MRLTLTLEIDHAILGDEQLTRRDIADKLTNVADLIRNGRIRNRPLDWRFGTLLDGDQPVVRWRVAG